MLYGFETIPKLHRRRFFSGNPLQDRGLFTVMTQKRDSMRRRDKQLAGHEELEEIIRRGEVCHLAFSDEGVPYVIPMNYGYSENSLYFHSAAEGGSSISSERTIPSLLR
jgi:hypothetical protein